MGWQDAPLVDAEGAQPKWASAPVVGEGPPGPRPPPQDAAPQQPNTWGQAVKNVAEGVGQFATGITGGIVGDIAGLGALGYDITANVLTDPFGPGEPGRFADPTAVRERVASALTYQPSNPQSLTSRTLQAPGRVIAGAGDFLGEQADKVDQSGTLGHFARAVPLATASALGAKAGMPVTSKQGVRIPNQVRPAPQATPEQVAIKNATDAGYKLTPTQVGNKVGGAAEGLSGQAALERSLSKSNVTITDNLAKRAVGISDDKPLNGATLGIERAKANKAYDAIAKTGKRKTSDEYRAEIASIDDRTGAGSFAEDVPKSVVNLKDYYASRPMFDAKDAVAKVRQLRKDGRANIKTRDPEKAALGNAQIKIAEALDNELARHADDLGMKDLAANYKAARVQLAKLSTVEDALAGTNVSAKKIWQQWKRGAPLQGELLAIARTYDSFSHVMQEASKIRQKHPFSVIDGFVAAGGALVDPTLVAAVAARPLARAALGSKTYQRNFVQPRGRPAQAPATRQPSQVTAPASTSLTTDAERRRSRGRGER